MIRIVLILGTTGVGLLGSKYRCFTIPAIIIIFLVIVALAYALLSPEYVVIQGHQHGL